MMKLDHAETCLRVAGDKRVWRKLMVFQCKEAAQHFMPSSNAWDADWAMTNGIEIMVVDAGEETRERVKAAQARQYR